MSNIFDLLVIGAGPAGLAAAATAAKLGLSVTLIDEQPAPGGQIHRGIESRTVQASSVSYADDARGAALVVEFRSCGAQYLSGTQVWQMEPDRKVYITDGTRTFCMQAKRVLIAVGAMERPVPIPGWTLPGVMTVGAAQIRYKTTGWLPPNGTNGTWLAGSGPLLWLYAAQVIEAGGCVAGILDTTPRSNYTQALRYAAGALRNHGYLIRGRALQNTVRKAGVRVVQDVLALEAQGEGQVSRVRYRVGDTWCDEAAAMVLLHQGVVPHVHASRSIGAQHRWDALQRAFAPETDAWGNLGVEGYAAAGDCAGIVGAEASALQGRLTALEAARALGVINEQQRNNDAAPMRAELARHLPVRPFLDQLFAPRASLLAPGDDVLVCRCESITARQLRDAVKLGAMGPNQVKAFTRCGMGPCQGRLCGLATAEIIAVARGVSMAETGVFNVRPPLKPLSLSELAALEGEP